ncbi:glycosyltransferase family 4 protein [Candidatus Gracilibacteria bacterium]|nr:glycosyltransferase family 4 protein [Candidatus Gracilibacteria bacterium]
MDPATITRFYNGCDTTDWPADSRFEARQRLGLPLDTPLIAYSGSIFQRDALLLAQAFDQVRAAYPTVRLLVLGYCNVAIETLVAEPSAVVRTGPLDTVTLRRYLRAADLGWAPLHDSGANRGRFPLKLSTYMEAGLPFVTTAVGDLGDFLRRYPAGLAADPNAAAVAATTISLLSNPEQALWLGTMGRAFAEAELSWTQVSVEVERVYRQLLMQRSLHIKRIRKRKNGHYYPKVVGILLALLLSLSWLYALCVGRTRAVLCSKAAIGCTPAMRSFAWCAVKAAAISIRTHVRQSRRSISTTRRTTCPSGGRSKMSATPCGASIAPMGGGCAVAPSIALQAIRQGAFSMLDALLVFSSMVCGG